MLPHGLKRVNWHAFGNTPLTQISIPSDLEYLHGSAFWGTPLCPTGEVFYESGKRIVRYPNTTECYLDGWLILYYTDNQKQYHIRPGTKGVADDSIHNVEEVFVPASVRQFCYEPTPYWYNPPASRIVYLDKDSSVELDFFRVDGGRLREVYPLVVRSDSKNQNHSISKIDWHSQYYKNIYRVYQKASSDSNAKELINKLEQGVVEEISALPIGSIEHASDWSYTKHEFDGCHGNGCITCFLAYNEIINVQLSAWTKKLSSFASLSLLNELEDWSESLPLIKKQAKLFYEVKSDNQEDHQLNLKIFKQIVAILYPWLEIVDECSNENTSNQRNQKQSALSRFTVLLQTISVLWRKLFGK